MNRVYNKNQWFKEYCICFLIGIGVFLLMTFLKQGTVIWGVDGFLMNHTTANYAKHFWEQLLQGNLVEMDLMLGEGGNPIHYMTYYGLMEPWNILYVITPSSWSIAIESVLLILRLFLSGCAFAWYAKRHTNNQEALTVGAVMYVFSGYFLFWLQAPTLINVGFLFPLLIGYLEDAIQKKSCIPLILVTSLAYITNYYTAAVMSFMLLAYGLVYLTTQGLWKHWKQWIPAVMAHAIGIAMSGFVLLPCAWAIVNGVRSVGHTGYDNWLVFPWQYYLDLIRHFFAPLSNSTLFWQHPYQSQNSYCLLALPAIITLCTSKEKDEKVKRMRILAIVGLIMLLVPAFGRLFNGNAYTTHRWTFALSMLVSMITVWALPQMQITKKTSLIIWGYIALSSALGFLFTIPDMATCMILTVTIPGLLLTIVPLKLSLRNLLRMSALFAVITSMLLGQYIGNFITYELIEQADLYAHVQVDTDFDKRTGQSTNAVGVNSGIIHNLYTNQTAWNVLLNAEGEYYHYAQLFPDMVHPSWPCSTDDRSSLQLLAGTKYYVTKEQDKDLLPLGFKYLYTKEVNNELTVHVYENQYHAGIGYALYDTMSTESFNQLNIAAKQEALMRYAIIDEGNVQLLSDAILIAYSSEVDNNVTTYTLQVPEGYELYMHIDSVISTQDSAWELTPDVLLSTASKATVNVLATDTDSDVKKVTTGYRDNAHLGQIHAMRTICLGHELSDTVTVQTEHRNGYTEGVRFYAIPINNLLDAAATLEENQWTNVQYTRTEECISGCINMKQDGIFQLAIPYSDGWKAYVDGQETEIIRSGIKYMGLKLSAGEHELRFEYDAPWSRIGRTISVGCFLLTLIWYLLERKPFSGFNFCSTKGKHMNTGKHEA